MSFCKFYHKKYLIYHLKTQKLRPLIYFCVFILLFFAVLLLCRAFGGKIDVVERDFKESKKGWDVKKGEKGSVEDISPLL